MHWQAKWLKIERFWLYIGQFIDKKYSPLGNNACQENIQFFSPKIFPISRKSSPGVCSKL
jgi:hypothetical protein